MSADRLARDLKTLFSQFGTCHPKIKQGKKKDLPGAFVQFEVSPIVASALSILDSVLMYTSSVSRMPMPRWPARRASSSMTGH